MSLQVTPIDLSYQRKTLQETIDDAYLVALTTQQHPEHNKPQHANPINEINTKLLLIISEITEAMEELRSDHLPTEVYFQTIHPEKPEGFPIELADAVLRIFTLARHLNIDLPLMIQVKSEYNATRPPLHGRSF